MPTQQNIGPQPLDADSGGTVTEVSGTAPIAVATGTTTPVVSLNDTAVTPGSYTTANITVDAKGRLTAAANGAGGITNSAPANTVPKSDGTNLVPSLITDSGTIVEIITPAEGVFRVGDLGAVGNGTILRVDDADSKIELLAPEIVVDPGANGTLITGNGSNFIAIDPSNGAIDIGVTGEVSMGNPTTKIRIRAADSQLDMAASATAKIIIDHPTLSIRLKATSVRVDATVTAAATVGAQTINKSAGSVNFAAAATSLVVTNSTVTASSIIIATVATDDTTMKSVAVVAGAGSFTLIANAAANAETRVNWWVITPQ